VNGINSNNFNHPNPLSKMIPRSVLLNSGIKSLTTAKQAVATARTTNRVYHKSLIKSATKFVKSAQIGKKTYFGKKVHNNHKWIPKISKPAVTTAMLAVTTARSKVSTGGSVNNKRVNLGNAVKASARWEWKPK
jgi:hypothetical protein